MPIASAPPIVRFRIVSDIEVPLVVEAADWRAALCIGMQLLEREDAVPRLIMNRIGDRVHAEDPIRGERYEVHPTVPVARALRQAA